MSENARRRPHPEAHQSERRIAEHPARAWAGVVRFRTVEGELSISGTWHLDLPHAPRALERPAGRTLPLPMPPLPPPEELSAWQAHLVRVVTLQVPGMQLRVRGTDDRGWRALEFAAPTAPPSVLLVDRAGLNTLLGPGTQVELRIAREERGTP